MTNYTEIVAGMASSAPRNKKEYLASDGVYRCKVCNQPTRTKINFGDRIIYPSIICDCDKAAEAERKERERLEEIDKKRRICFAQKTMRSWTFDNDDKMNEQLSNAMRNYAENFQKFRCSESKYSGKGLLLYGSVGTGKSFYAACIANRVIEMGYSAKMTNFATLTNDLHGMNEGRNQYIEDLNRCDLLIIDDLGAERKSDYMQEMVFNIIDSRYSSGLPMIITTNLSGDDIKKPENIGFARIYDRLIGSCQPLEVAGHSRRKQGLRESFGGMQAILGV